MVHFLYCCGRGIWSVGVVGYMLAAKALEVELPPCTESYRLETYREYLYEYEQQRQLQQGASLYPEEEELLLPVSAAEPYFSTLPSVDPEIRKVDDRDHGSALVNIISLLLDVSPSRRLSITTAEYSVRQLLRRVVALGDVEGASILPDPTIHEVKKGEAAAEKIDGEN